MGRVRLLGALRRRHMRQSARFPWRARRTPSICLRAWDIMATLHDRSCFARFSFLVCALGLFFIAALLDHSLNGPIYRTKDELWKRLCEYEARAEQQLRERHWVEARKEELIQGARPHEAEIPDAWQKRDDLVET